MPSPKLQRFTLTPHVPLRVDEVRSLQGQLFRSADELKVRYLLEGDLDRLRVPEPETSRFADELWQHTCFELFLARKGETRYLELNFSPSGEWAAYAFTRYRERAQGGADLIAIDPQVVVQRSTYALELHAIVRLDRTAPHLMNAPLMLGVSAVIEGCHGGLSYWALKHPSNKPDFHHPDAFVLELDEIRN